MRKPFKSSNSITNYTRAQTAKLRKTLSKTLQKVKNQRDNQESKSNYFIPKRPKTPTSYFLNMEQINPTHLSTINNNIYNKNTSRTKFTRPNTSNTKKYNITSNTEKNEYQKAHLNEVNIQNLFTEKLWEKHNKEKNEDYTKKLAYKKLIMRAKLLKAMKINIVLKKKQFEEYNEKYSTGNKLLSDKLKYRNKNNNKKDESEDEYSYSDSPEKPPDPPNFNSLKHPDIFSNYEYTSLFKDFHCTPIELIKKIFNPEEQKIINLDPIFFRLNKEPFNSVQKNLRFNLKDKINEEDRIFQQKLKMAKERNKKFNVLQKKKEEQKLIKVKTIPNGNNLSENEKKENYEENKNENEISDKENKKYIKAYTNTESENISKINKHNISSFKNNSKNNKKKYKYKGNNSLGIKVNKMKSKKNSVVLNINTDYNVYLETHMANYKNRMSLGNNNPKIEPIYSGDEKIKDKKKKLTMQELFDIYNERKKTYLDDMSYNRTRNKYKFEQLRIKHHQDKENEAKKKESLRNIMFKIEQNYKLYQK